MRKILYLILSAGLVTAVISCKKNWLDAKPNISLVVPSSVSDYQSLLDNTGIFNLNQPALGEIGSADFTMTVASYNSLATDMERNTFLWQQDIPEENELPDWTYPYEAVFNSNVTMEGLANVSKTIAGDGAWNNVEGSALFYRANAFYNVAQVFCKTYVTSTSGTDAGIVLRLKSDVTVKSVRSTVGQTYNQIIADLASAKTLLPVTPLYKTRPSKPAAFALLAKAYLVMQDYNNALTNADSCIKLYPGLIDYNTVSTTAPYPFPLFNSEVIFHSSMVSYSSLAQSKLLVDPVLYSLYAVNDLRKTLFFKAVTGGYTFKGSYYGGSHQFDGIASDEIYLIRAECYARTGNIPAAVADLNTLLQNRYKTGTYVPYDSSITADSALSLILQERRKELLLRGIRWSDLRRLNLSSPTAVTLTKAFNGQSYSLPPNDIRYVLPIPPDEIQISGIQQNPR